MSNIFTIFCLSLLSLLNQSNARESGKPGPVLNRQLAVLQEFCNTRTDLNVDPQINLIDTNLRQDHLDSLKATVLKQIDPVARKMLLHQDLSQATVFFERDDFQNTKNYLAHIEFHFAEQNLPPSFYFLRAECNYSLKNYQAALSDYTITLRFSDTPFTAELVFRHLSLSTFLNDSLAFSQSYPLFLAQQDAFSQKQSDVLYFFAAIHFMSFGEFEKARAAVEKVSQETAFERSVYFLKGVVAAAQNQWQHAENALLRAAKFSLNPFEKRLDKQIRDNAFIKLGYIALLQENFRKANVLFEKVDDDSPFFDYAVIGKTWVAMKQGHFQFALDALRNQQLETDNELMKSNLLMQSICLNKMKKYGEQRRILQQLLALKNNTAGASTGSTWVAFDGSAEALHLALLQSQPVLKIWPEEKWSNLGLHLSTNWKQLIDEKIQQKRNFANQFSERANTANIDPNEKLQKLKAEIIASREQAITELQAFVKRHPANVVNDWVIYTLGELLYQQGLVISGQSEEYFAKAYAMYEQLVQIHHDSDLLDDAIYQMVYIAERLGNETDIQKVAEQFLHQFPESEYRSEILMRLAEFHFSAQSNQTEKAIKYYRQILAYPDSPRFQEAQFRLGWCYSKLERYHKAITYFANLIELEAQQPHSRFFAEAMTNLSAAFVASSGLSGAKSFLIQRNFPTWGAKLLETVADTYHKHHAKDALAADAYLYLLKAYRGSVISPSVYQGLAAVYSRLGKNTESDSLHRLIITQYGNPTGATDSRFSQQQKIAGDIALSYIDDLLRQAHASQHISDYKKCLTFIDLFLEHFSNGELTDKILWNKAVILDSKFGQSTQALTVYEQLIDVSSDSGLIEKSLYNAIAISLEQIDKDPVEIIPKSGWQLRFAAPSELDPKYTQLLHFLEKFTGIYPHREEAMRHVLRIGIIYYTFNRVEKAAACFEKVIRTVPKSAEFEKAERLLLESYLAGNELEHARRFAKSVADNPNNNNAEFATKRLAEIAFYSKHHQLFSGFDMEITTIVDSISNTTFLDFTLFQLALRAESEGDDVRALQLYNQLIDNYSYSEYHSISMQNMASLHIKNNAFENAASIYSQLAMVAKQPLEIAENLYNALFYLDFAGEWAEAIVLGNEHLKKINDTAYTQEILLLLIKACIKENAVNQKKHFVAKFNTLFPESLRQFEIHLMQAHYYLQSREYEAAKNELSAVASYHHDHPATRAFASEALLHLAKISAQETVIFDNQPDVDIAQKVEKHLPALLGHLAKIIPLRTRHGMDALFLIAESHRVAAQKWLMTISQASSISGEEDIIHQLETIEALLQKADEAYSDGLAFCERIADVLNNSREVDFLQGDFYLHPALNLTKTNSIDWHELFAERRTVLKDTYLGCTLLAGEILSRSITELNLEDFAKFEYKSQMWQSILLPKINRALQFAPFSDTKDSTNIITNYKKLVSWVMRDRSAFSIELAQALKLELKQLSQELSQRTPAIEEGDKLGILSSFLSASIVSKQLPFHFDELDIDEAAALFQLELDIVRYLTSLLQQLHNCYDIANSRFGQTSDYGYEDWMQEIDAQIYQMEQNQSLMIEFINKNAHQFKTGNNFFKALGKQLDSLSLQK